MITTTRLIGRVLNSVINSSTNAIVVSNALESKRNLSIWYPDAKFEREFKVGEN